MKKFIKFLELLNEKKFIDYLNTKCEYQCSQKKYHCLIFYFTICSKIKN
jgi:hypothetical protein